MSYKLILILIMNYKILLLIICTLLVNSCANTPFNSIMVYDKKSELNSSASNWKEYNLDGGIQVSIPSEWSIASDFSNLLTMFKAKAIVSKKKILPKEDFIEINSVKTLLTASKREGNNKATIAVTITPSEITQEELKYSNNFELGEFEDYFKERYMHGIRAVGGRDLKLDMDKVIVNGLYALKIQLKFKSSDSSITHMEKIHIYTKEKTVLLSLEKKMYGGEMHIVSWDGIISSLVLND